MSKPAICESGPKLAVSVVGQRNGSIAMFHAYQSDATPAVGPRFEQLSLRRPYRVSCRRLFLDPGQQLLPTLPPHNCKTYPPYRSRSREFAGNQLTIF